MTDAADSPTPVEDLLARARAYVTHSHAKNTLDAYAADWKHFSAWCEQHKRRALPASPETILCYVVDLVDRFTVATIDRRLSSIGYYHKQARHSLPTKDPEVERTMRGIRRAKGIAPHGKAPILTPLLRQMVEALPDDVSGLRDKAILLLGFAGAFRRSEIVGLHLRDVQLSDAGLIITLRRSKTDQEGASFTKGIPMGTSDATCPKCALNAWLQLAGITSGPIFRPVDRWGHVGNRALSSLGVARAVKRALTALEVDTEDYSGHSLRAGLVTAAAMAGVSERVIMQQTGHKNTAMLRRYIREGSLSVRMQLQQSVYKRRFVSQPPEFGRLPLSRSILCVINGYHRNQELPPSFIPLLLPVTGVISQPLRSPHMVAFEKPAQHGLLSLVEWLPNP